MISAIIWSVVTFAILFIILDYVEKRIHQWRKNPDASYRWGVWVFAILGALYVLVTSLGR